MILTMILTDKPDFAPPPEFAPYDGHYSRIQLLEQGNETIMCMYVLKKLRTQGTKNSYVYRPNFYTLNWKLTEQQQKEGIFTSNSFEDPEIAFDDFALFISITNQYDYALLTLAKQKTLGFLKLLWQKGIENSHNQNKQVGQKTLNAQLKQQGQGLVPQDPDLHGKDLQDSDRQNLGLQNQNPLKQNSPEQAPVANDNIEADSSMTSNTGNAVNTGAGKGTGKLSETQASIVELATKTLKSGHSTTAILQQMKPFVCCEQATSITALQRRLSGELGLLSGVAELLCFGVISKQNTATAGQGSEYLIKGTNAALPLAQQQRTITLSEHLVQILSNPARYEHISRNVGLYIQQVKVALALALDDIPIKPLNCSDLNEQWAALKLIWTTASTGYVDELLVKVEKDQQRRRAVITRRSRRNVRKKVYVSQAKDLAPVIVKYEEAALARLNHDLKEKCSQIG
ncbi:MAG: hypothetical protein HRT35_33090 [Algicola sp.]|nr:hypothetical protein [Algicola sp.]